MILEELLEDALLLSKNEIVNSYEQYSNSKLDSKLLDTNINTWTDIDNSYINYMRTIGIYK